MHKFLVAAAFCAVASMANAATLVVGPVSFSNASLNGGTIATLAIQQFNPALGTLNSIDFSFNGTVVSSNGVVVNNTGSNTTNNNVRTINDMTVLDPLTNVLIADTFFNVTYTPGGFALANTATQNVTGGSNNQTVNNLGVTNATILSEFTGLGNVNVTPQGSTSRAITNNLGVQSGIVATGSGGLTVTYNYTLPASVPEPTSMGLMGVSLLGLGLFGRRFKK